MRRTKRREFVMTEAEAQDLKKKAEMVRMSESQLIRLLISGYHPPEAPGKEFFGAMNRLAEQVNRIEEMTRRERDTEIRNMLFDESMQLKEMRINLVRKYLTGKDGQDPWR